MILDHHRATLEQESRITKDVWQARGFRSIEKATELKRLGFSEAQTLVPTLLIPVYNVWGDLSLYHHRPDNPRINRKTGRTNKYEFPSGSTMCFDVHPFVKDKIRDPNVPLIITEGSKKNDSIISHGGCSIGVIGVWNWRGSNEWGGKTTLPDWESIALKKSDDSPRLVYLIFDSDAMLKPAVYLALSRLAAFLKKRGAKVLFVYLPHSEDGSKTGVDDFLALGHSMSDVYDLASPILKSLPDDPQSKSPLPYIISSYSR